MIAIVLAVCAVLLVLGLLYWYLGREPKPKSKPPAPEPEPEPTVEPWMSKVFTRGTGEGAEMCTYSHTDNGVPQYARYTMEPRGVSYVTGDLADGTLTVGDATFTELDRSKEMQQYTRNNVHGVLYNVPFSEDHDLVFYPNAATGRITSSLVPTSGSPSILPESAFDNGTIKVTGHGSVSHSDAKTWAEPMHWLPFTDIPTYGEEVIPLEARVYQDQTNDNYVFHHQGVAYIVVDADVATDEQVDIYPASILLEEKEMPLLPSGAKLAPAGVEYMVRIRTGQDTYTTVLPPSGGATRFVVSETGQDELVSYPYYRNLA